MVTEKKGGAKTAKKEQAGTVEVPNVIGRITELVEIAGASAIKATIVFRRPMKPMVTVFKPNELQDHADLDIIADLAISGKADVDLEIFENGLSAKFPKADEEWIVLRAKDIRKYIEGKKIQYEKELKYAERMIGYDLLHLGDVEISQ